jgi:hypothetical protein
MYFSPSFHIFVFFVGFLSLILCAFDFAIAKIDDENLNRASARLIGSGPFLQPWRLELVPPPQTVLGICKARKI